MEFFGTLVTPLTALAWGFALLAIAVTAAWLLRRRGLAADPHHVAHSMPLPPDHRPVIHNASGRHIDLLQR
ncbi:MAG: hypothetical protein ACN6O6_10785 [Pseudomonas sp.]|uniref:hypothetical protein n=1 Tax=Pseudomonas sp. TaxID=306 RepID=UPI003D0BC0CE